MKKYIPCTFSLLLLLYTHVYSQSADKAKYELLTVQQIEMIVDTICDRVEQGYVYADKGKNIADYLRTQFKTGVYNKHTDPKELAGVLTNDMRRVCYDGHLTVRFSAPVPASSVPNTPSRTTSIPHKEVNFNLKAAEILPGNVGYFRFDGFTDDEDVQPVLENALHFLERGQALIIDIRYNGGGSRRMVNLIESYLFDKKTEMNAIIGRSGKDTARLFTDPAAAKGFTLNMPVFILTSHKTFSAAEDFAYGMQSIHRAQTVGEASGGGAHPVQNSPIGYGLVLTVPFMRAYNPYTHKDWEGVGVIPDIHCTADSALEIALSKIYQQNIANSDTQEDKIRYKWLNDRIMAKEIIVSSQTLQKYAGTYGEHFRLFVKGNQLYCTDLHMNNFTFQLHPVSTETFYSGPENDLKITMIKSGKGVYSTLDALWSVGHEDVMEKHN